MTNAEAIEKLREFCKLRAFCELYPDACQKDKCEIYMAIEALSAQPEIIRCKDCIYQKESWCGIKYCEANGDHIGKDYDYCSNVRRKDNG